MLQKALRRLLILHFPFSNLSKALYDYLSHWGRVTHTCVGKLTITGSDNGLSSGRHQAIIRTNAGILLIGTLGTNFSEFLSKIQTFLLKKIRLKMSSAKCCSFRRGLNVLRDPFHNGFIMESWPSHFYNLRNQLSPETSILYTQVN